MYNVIVKLKGECEIMFVSSVEHRTAADIPDKPGHRHQRELVVVAGVVGQGQMTVMPMRKAKVEGQTSVLGLCSLRLGML